MTVSLTSATAQANSNKLSSSGTVHESVHSLLTMHQHIRDPAIMPKTIIMNETSIEIKVMHKVSVN